MAPATTRRSSLPTTTPGEPDRPQLTLSAFPDLGFANEDYRIVSFTADASPLNSTGEWISAVINETAEAIA